MDKWRMRLYTRITYNLYPSWYNCIVKVSCFYDFRRWYSYSYANTARFTFTFSFSFTASFEYYLFSFSCYWHLRRRTRTSDNSNATKLYLVSLICSLITGLSLRRSTTNRRFNPDSSSELLQRSSTRRSRPRFCSFSLSWCSTQFRTSRDAAVSGIFSVFFYMHLRNFLNKCI